MTTTALSAGTITGDKARNPAGDKLGHIEELVIDLESGRVLYAVLASGGFLGMGDKYFAIPWDLLTVDTDSHEVVVDVSKETLQNAPGFDRDSWPEIHDRTWLGDVYRYYGHEPYWEDDSIDEVAE
ncbi:MAG TPA: PRC-barrel domain-containing protein [Acidimicrobiia bacterium]|nr:PRC-barrel domain-containing protein [Acidimicrobiia bacterium]